MFKSRKSPSPATKTSERGTPLIVLATFVTGMILAYFIGLLTFQYKHPIHWGLAAVGGIVGWLIGRLIYRLRGYTDII